MNENPGLATGVLLLLFGVWVVSRTLVHDAQGFNLVDRIIALAGGGTPSTGKSGQMSGSPLTRLLFPLGPGQVLPKGIHAGTPSDPIPLSHDQFQRLVNARPPVAPALPAGGTP